MMTDTCIHCQKPITASDGPRPYRQTGNWYHDDLVDIDNRGETCDTGDDPDIATPTK